MSTLRNTNGETKCTYLPCNHYIKGFEQMFNDFGIKVAHNTKHTLLHFIRKIKLKISNNPEYMKKTVECNENH